MSKNGSPSGWRLASGHAETSRAAACMLELGGNAADAAVAAAFAATVAEPLLCSLGGGGLGLVHRQGQSALALDCFTQTPRRQRLDGLDFYPIIGNFGTDTQEFHVGMASIATPGAVAGLCALNQRFGRLPLGEVVQPAIELARKGVALNAVQRYALEILEPIVRSSTDCARMFGLADQAASLPGNGQAVGNPALADFLDQLGREGPRLFYFGEPARRLAADSVSNGGHLGLDDLQGYRVAWRRPLRWRYRDALIWSCPPPAFGGMMLALACQQLAHHLSETTRPHSPRHLAALCAAMADSEDLRRRLEEPSLLASDRSLRQAFEGLSDESVQSRRGTTHISIDDGAGMAVSLTLSNGEGSGYVLPGTGIHLNNMLGEEDINRTGFHQWPRNRRLASMMTPTLVQRGPGRKPRRWLLGSGGSNRIRTALVQVISNLVDFDMSLDEAVNAPRLHLEQGRLAVETPADTWPAETLDWLMSSHPGARWWPERNLYFGGVHAVGPEAAAADPRRLGRAMGHLRQD